MARLAFRSAQDFAGVMHSDSYHVFLTPQGDSKGLFVANKTPNGFSVHEQQGGTSSIAFDYRVVAKRKDIAGPRMEEVAEMVPHPGAIMQQRRQAGRPTDVLPKPPVLPPLPELPRH